LAQAFGSGEGRPPGRPRPPRSRATGPRAPMAKARKKGGKQGPQTVRFDVKARYAYLTGFRKRKEARRRKALLQQMEKERQENIEVRRDAREEIKRSWREVQFAVKRTEKALGYAKVRALEDRRADCAGTKEAPLLEDVANSADEAAGAAEQTTVAFERIEDGDAFGDCEVTTTADCVGPLAAVVPSAGGGAAAGGPLEDPSVARSGGSGSTDDFSSRALARRRRRDGWEDDEEAAERHRRRMAAIAKEERFRKAAVERKLLTKLKGPNLGRCNSKGRTKGGSRKKKKKGARLKRKAAKRNKRR